MHGVHPDVESGVAPLGTYNEVIIGSMSVVNLYAANVPSPTGYLTLEWDPVSMKWRLSPLIRHAEDGQRLPVRGKMPFTHALR